MRSNEVAPVPVSLTVGIPDGATDVQRDAIINARRITFTDALGVTIAYAVRDGHAARFTNVVTYTITHAITDAPAEPVHWRVRWWRRMLGLRQQHVDRRDARADTGAAHAARTEHGDDARTDAHAEPLRLSTTPAMRPDWTGIHNPPADWPEASEHGHSGPAR